MELVRNQFYRVLEVFTAFLLLNMIWVAACLPIVTIFPATAALFSVVRKWNDEGIDFGVLKPFLKSFKQNFKKSFLIGTIWSVIAAILIFDVYILNQLMFTGQIVIVSLLIFCSILFLFTSVYLLPVFVNYELSIRATFKNALFLALGKIGTTLITTICVATILVITYFFPFLLLVFASLSGFIVYSLCSRTFDVR